MRASSKWLLALSMIVAAGTAACLSDPPDTASEAEAVSRPEEPSSTQYPRCGDDIFAHRNWELCCDGVCRPHGACGFAGCAVAAPAASEQPLTTCRDPQNPGHDNWVDCCGDGVCYAPNVCRFVACGT